MRVSVVICTYAEERYDAFTEAVASVQSQTYQDLELILVIDGNRILCDQAKRDFGDDPQVRIHCNDENLGNLESINRGIELAQGDVIANIDDDATAAPNWIEQLVAAYREHDAFAAGGPIEPDWVDGVARFIPEEFLWLIGVTHKGVPDEPGEVRNTFGSNLSFRSDIIEQLGGYPTDEDSRDSRFQAGETALCARLHREYGRGVYYVPEAIVYHKIFSYRTDVSWLLQRAFWQGVSKRWMEVTHPAATSDERDYVRQLLTEFVPSRVISQISRPSMVGLAQLTFLFGLLGATGMGYAYGFLTKVGDT